MLLIPSKSPHRNVSYSKLLSPQEGSSILEHVMQIVVCHSVLLMSNKRVVLNPPFQIDVICSYSPPVVESVSAEQSSCKRDAESFFSLFLSFFIACPHGCGG